MTTQQGRDDLADTLRRRPRGPVVGAILPMPAETLVEMIAAAGLDFVVIDGEHGPADTLALRHHVTAAEAAGLRVLVRTAGVVSADIQRALDLGARGVVVPHVGSAREAAAAVRAAHYPPRGNRGVATYTRAARYGQVSSSEHVMRAGTVVVVCMVEDLDAVEQAAAIAGTEGVDGVLVGTGDLAADVGARGLDPERAGLAAAEAEAAVQSAGSTVLRLTSDAEQTRVAVADGCIGVLNAAALVMTALGEVRAAGS